MFFDFSGARLSLLLHLNTYTDSQGGHSTIESRKLFLGVLVQELLKTRVQHSLSLKLLKPFSNHRINCILKYLGLVVLYGMINSI